MIFLFKPPFIGDWFSVAMFHYQRVSKCDFAKQYKTYYLLVPRLVEPAKIAGSTLRNFGVDTHYSINRKKKHPIIREGTWGNWSCWFHSVLMDQSASLTSRLVLLVGQSQVTIGPVAPKQLPAAHIMHWWTHSERLTHSDSCPGLTDCMRPGDGLYLVIPSMWWFS